MSTPSLSPPPQPTTTPMTGSDPPRRRFGSFASSNGNVPKPRPGTIGRPSSSSSNRSLSPTSSPAFLIPPAPPGPQRTRSASSASSTGNTSSLGAGTSGGPTSPAAAFDITLAADKAQQWLSTWAPRGEGRGREFLNNTLNGVASVASTVSSGLNARATGSVAGVHDREGLGGGSRPNSFVSFPPSSTGSASTASPSTSPESRIGGGSTPNSPPAPLHTSSTPQLSGAQIIPGGGPSSGGRKIPQPANLARLGHAATTPTAPTLNDTASTTSSGTQSLRPAISLLGSAGSTSTTSLPPTQPHGPSHLGPNASSTSINNHRRTSSTTSHHRTSSFGLGSLSTQLGGGTGGKSPSVSRSSSVTAKSGPSMTTRSAGMPYKIGFQPQGVRADRTGEYVEVRKLKGEDREKEEGRLGRRWAKLVDLHFNPTAPQPLPVVPILTRSSSSTFSISSLASVDKRRSLLSIDGALDALKPKEMFKGFKGPTGPGGDEGRKRAAEQAIVKWEDDSEVKKCRICQSSFSLSNRKHHCRLCGRIVCSLPPTPPALLAVQIQLFAPADPSATSTQMQAGLPPGTRREKCSLLLVADWKTGRGEEVEEGFVGWMKVEDVENESPSTAARSLDGGGWKKERRRSRLSTGGGADGGARDDGRLGVEGEQKRDVPLPQQPKEVQVKGMRVCRECWNVVSRKQKIQDQQRVTGFARLYQAMRTLQSEIEDLIPDYEDQLMELTESTEAVDPPPETVAMHKNLLTLFTQYEHLSKRITNLPCEEGGSQASVQSAVARSAAGFLGKEMVKLQALPRLQKKAAAAKRKSIPVLETTLADTLKLEGDEHERALEDVAVFLQPLLEQEAQLESYIADANAQRKYEDGKALQEALKEIRAEIERITKAGK
ncbi:hypothetical protein IAR55_005441 [Kwoniella newhampshirensis]|uniref:FYVE-type domain-containing protein n=1 Tax=Kwoniella newhampshirensis TaxID=1651941 RepID=A0AAW0YVK0_9TREE